MLAPKILLVSNRQSASPLLAFNVMQLRLNIVVERQLSRVIQRWSEEVPDIILFELEPGEAHPTQLIRELREQAVIPILLLSFNPHDRLVMEAYEAGVDEYVLQPVHPLILEAKIKAWLRRSWSIPVEMLDSLKVGDIHFIPAERSVIFDHHHPIRLTNLELRLMFYLMSHPGRTVKTEELCQRIWGDYTEGKKTTLKNVVYRLRLKIEADPTHPHYIRTVAGVGYQFASS